MSNIFENKGALVATIVVAASDSLNQGAANYVCDGAADEVEIQAAIDALPTGGGTVLLLEGTFNISSRIELVSNMILAGCGFNTLLYLINAAEDHVIYADGSASAKENIIVRDLQVDGNDANQVGAVNLNGIHFEHDVWESTIENTWVHNCKDLGIVCWGSVANHAKDIVIQSNTCYDNVRDGIAVDNDCERIVISNNICNNNVGFGIGIGSDVVNCVISDNICTGNLIGFYIAVACHYNLIANNVFANNTTHGIRYIGASLYNVITGNYIYGNGRNGIIFENGNTDTYAQICNNYIYLNGWHGMDLYQSSYNIIQGNVILNNSQDTTNTYDGIRIRSTSTHNVISENFIRSDVVNVHRYCYEEAAAVDNNNTVKHNYMSGAGTALMLIQGADTRAWLQFSDLFMDVLAVSATQVRSNEDLSAGVPITFTIDAQPDVPRTLSGLFDTHANITAYTIVITGVDAKGNTVTETITEADGWDWETSNAFATITSIIMSARTGTGVGDTMDIGITDVLGLSNVIYETGDVYKIKKNNANAVVAGAQVDTDYATYDMAVIGLGAADDFTIWYRSNLNIVE